MSLQQGPACCPKSKRAWALSARRSRPFSCSSRRLGRLRVGVCPPGRPCLPPGMDRTSTSSAVSPRRARRASPSCACHASRAPWRGISNTTTTGRPWRPAKKLRHTLVAAAIYSVDMPSPSDTTILAKCYFGSSRDHHGLESTVFLAIHHNRMAFLDQIPFLPHCCRISSCACVCRLGLALYKRRRFTGVQTFE